jgi:hypothetical protein
MSQEPTFFRSLVGYVRSGELPFWLAFAAAFLSLPFIAWIAWAQPSGPVITSSPSVSATTETSVVITWQTDRLSTSEVLFGETPALGETYRKIIPIEETEVFEVAHSMTLWQLRPGTTYHYMVASVDEAGGRTESAVFTFQTASPALSVTPVPPVESVEAETPKGEPAEAVPETPTAPAKPPKTELETVAVPKPEPVPVLKPTEAKPAVTAVTPVAQAPTIPLPIKPRPALPVEDQDVQAPVSPVAPMPAVAVSEKMDRALVEFRSAAGATPTAAPAPEGFPLRQGAGGQAASAPSVTGQAASSIDPLCTESGIGAVRCQKWLVERFADKTCAAAGLLTRESCEAFLSERNGGVFPGCEGQSDEACRRVKELTTFGYFPAEVREKANEVIALAQTESFVPAVPEITSVSAAAAPDAKWWASVAAPGVETSPAVVVFDADRDGLPDDFERAHGTNPNLADTDGDGASDAEEMRIGTDPLGTDEMQKKLYPTALAVVNHLPLGQPRGAGSVSEDFKVRAPVAEPAPGDVFAPAPGVVISGTCAPSSTCLIYVYSYAPMVLTTVADENGNWTYDLGETVGDGEHTVYVAVTDETGKVTRKSNPLSFFVSEARAISSSDFLHSDASAPTEPIDRFQRWYVWGLAGLIIVALASAGLVLRRFTRTKTGA